MPFAMNSSPQKLMTATCQKETLFLRSDILMVKTKNSVKIQAAANPAVAIVEDDVGGGGDGGVVGVHGHGRSSR